MLSQLNSTQYLERPAQLHEIKKMSHHSLRRHLGGVFYDNLVDLCYMDINNSFNSVKYKLIIARLKYFQLVFSVTYWTGAFFSNRSFQLHIG